MTPMDRERIKTTRKWGKLGTENMPSPGKCIPMVLQGQIISLENIHTVSIIWTYQGNFTNINVYINTCKHTKTVSKRKDHELKGWCGVVSGSGWISKIK